MKQRKNWEYCLEDLKEKSFDIWSDDDKAKAAEICGAFHIVGVLAWQRAILKRLLARILYYSLPETFEILKPYLTSTREKRGPSYWIGYDLLLRIHFLNKKKAYRRAMYRLDLDNPQIKPDARWLRRLWETYWISSLMNDTRKQAPKRNDRFSNNVSEKRQS